MPKYILGVDVGGTKIATGLVNKNGKLLSKTIVPTFAAKGFKCSLKQVYSSISEMISVARVKNGEIAGIGICAPGPLNPAKGIIYNPPNLPGWKNINIVALLKKKFGIRTILENDANAAGMAELIWGAAKGHKHVFYVTVSTGIGTAVIIDGKIYHGKNGMAGEGGHVTINFEKKDSRCNCGNIGCIETLASGTNVVKRLMKETKTSPETAKALRKISNGKIKNINMELIGNAAKKGDKFASKVVKQQGKMLGVWLGGMISILDPEIIVIGGGVSLIGNILFKEIRKTIPSYTINKFAKKTPVVSAKLKHDVGILGAASIVSR